MTALADPMAQSQPPDHRAVIHACLKRIQRRLWSVRLAERLALALAWAALIAVPLTVSRLLRDPHPYWAALIAAISLLPATFLWLKSHSLGRGILTLALLKITALLTAALSLAAVLLAIAVSNSALPIWTVPLAVALIFLAAAAASVRMIDARSAAIFVDQQAGLEERVATALELLQSPAPDSPLETAFHAPVVESALAACHLVKRAKVGYQRLDRRVYALAALLAIGSAALLAIPVLAPPPIRHATHPYVEVVTRAQTLADALKHIQDAKLPNDQATADKIKPLQNTLERLLKGDMSPIEASTALEMAKSELRRDQAAMEASNTAQDKLKTVPALRDLNAAQSALKDAKAAQAAGDPAASAQQQAALKAMQAAADALGNQMKSAASQPGAMTDSQKNDLANGLKDAAAQAGADPQLQRDLERAAGAAQKGDSSGLSQNLQSAGERMAQQQSDHALSQDAVNRAMGEISQAQNNGQSAAEQQASANNAAGQPSPSGNQGQSQNPSGSANSGQSPNGNQPGQKPGDGPGQGQQAGGSPAKGNAPGQAGSQAQAQAGEPDSTNLEQRGGPGEKHGGPIGGTGTFVKIYDEDHINTQGKTEKVTGQVHPLGPAAGTITIKGAGDVTPSDIVGYDDQIPAARQRMMDDMSKQEIPPQYQDLVREFYAPPAASPAPPAAISRPAATAPSAP